MQLVNCQVEQPIVGTKCSICEQTLWPKFHLTPKAVARVHWPFGDGRDWILCQKHLDTFDEWSC